MAVLLSIIFNMFYHLAITDRILLSQCLHYCRILSQSYFYKRRGNRSGKRKQKPIPTITGHRPSVHTHHTRPPATLTQVKTLSKRAQSQKINQPNTQSCRNGNTLRTMTLNFQSMLPKKVEFWNIIHNNKPDIIIGSETWLKPDVQSSEIFPPESGYNVFRKDRHDGYGGVIIATKNDLSAHEINTQTNTEAVFVKINTKQGALTVGSMYRTPSNTAADQMSALTSCLDNLDKDNIIWIGGDFNLPDINWEQERATGHQYPISISNTFIDKMRDLGLTQINDTPTRGNKILDLFLTNRPSLVIKCTTIPGLSDHDIVITDSTVNANKIIKTPHTVTIWKKANINAMRTETRLFSNEMINQTYTNVEEAWSSINDHLNKIMEKHVPTKACSTKFHQPWVNTLLRRLSRKKHRAWARARRSNLPTHWERYELLKKDTRRENRKAYQNYVKNLIIEDSNKNLWRFIKSRKCDVVGVAPLNDENIMYTNDKDKANVLNNQFCSVFTSEVNETIPTPNAKNHPVMADITITENGVENLLSNLKPKKASGPDNIPSRLLQLIAKEITPALTKLFQLSLNTGEIPNIWKHATVQPVYKKGDRSAAQNYRPISLTCICCKLLEHIVRSAITNHLESNNILNDAQHGFRKHRSCETQLITITQDIASVLDRGGQMDIILLDFAKAFDKVPHKRLIQKLQKTGTNEKTLQWIKAFLSGRTQQVVVNGEVSETGQVTSGVPQGSVLGPSLFLIYINDLPDEIKSKVRLFADDTAMYRHISSIEDCTALNNDLSKLQEWEEKWLMKFNVSKCHVLSITNKKNPIKHEYQLHGQILQHVRSAKYLGIELSHNLKWSTHISNIASKASKTSAFIWRNLKGCPISTQVHAYKTIARPILEYASAVWDPHHKQDINTIEKTQRRATRRINQDFSPMTSVTELTRKIGLETLLARRKINKITTFHKIYRKQIGLKFPDCVKPISRKTRGHCAKMLTPSAKTNLYLHSFFPSTVRMWNDLPSEAVESECPKTFKKIVHHKFTNF